MKGYIIVGFLLFSFSGLSQEVALRLNLSHTSEITGLTFSEDERYLLSASVDRTLRFWNVERGKLLRTSPKIPGSVVGELGLLGDNQIAVVPEEGARGVKAYWMWNIETGALQDMSPQSQVRQRQTYTQGNRKAFKTDARLENSIKRSLRDLPSENFIPKHYGFTQQQERLFSWTGKEMHYYQMNETPKVAFSVDENMDYIAFSSTGRYFFNKEYGLSLGRSDTRIYDAGTGALVSRFDQQRLGVPMDVNSDASAVLIVDRQGKCFLYDPKTNQELRTFSGTLDKSQRESRTTWAKISPREQFVARGTANGTIYLHDYRTGTILNAFQSNTKTLSKVAFDKTGSKIFLQDQSQEQFHWDLDLGVLKLGWETPFPEESIPDGFLAVSNDGKWGIKRRGEQQLLLINLQTNHTEQKIDPGAAYDQVAFVPGAQSIVLINSQDMSQGKPIYRDNLYWDLTANKKIHSFHPYANNASTAFDVSDDGQYLMVGYESGIVQLFSLERVDGLEKKIALNTYACSDDQITGLDIAPNGKTAICISSSRDGKAYLLGIEEKVALAYLVKLGDSEWVVSAPNGLFDASQRAFDKLFYRTDYRGEPLIIELNQLKARYYEPGLLSKLLGLSDEQMRPVEGFNLVKLYPGVLAEIIGNKLQVELFPRNGGVGHLSVFANGKEIIADANPLVRGSTTGRNRVISVDLKKYENFFFTHPDSINIVSLQTHNAADWLAGPFHDLKYKVSSNVAQFIGSEEDPLPNEKGPNLYAIIIGTRDYQGEDLDLQFSDQDATLMARAIEAVGNSLFTDESTLEVHCLSTANMDSTGLERTNIQWRFSDKKNIRKVFKEIGAKAKAEDILLVYLSGHGVAHGTSDDVQFHYLTHAAGKDISDPLVRKAFTISSSELTTWINQIPALKQVLMIDACNSGQVVESLTLGSKNMNSSQVRALERMKDRTGMFVISGSAADKVSFEASQFGQGLLTYALLQGMRGVATRETAYGEFIDVMQLFQYAKDEVPRLANSTNSAQIPMVGFPSRGASFDIGILNDEVKAAIEVGDQKPVVIRSIFMNENSFDDNLQLTQAMELALRKETEKGKDADLIYVDVNSYPGAYAIRCLYTKNSEGIQAKVKVLKDGEQIDLPIRVRKDANDLAKEIKKALQKIL